MYKTDITDVAQRVAFKQNKIKRWYDNKWKVSPNKFSVGDLVRIRKPGYISKCSDKFGKPMKIVSLKQCSYSGWKDVEC